ncbi:MAG: PDZ domain-containing protein [Candidatus Anammoxibacter sp.]
MRNKIKTFLMVLMIVSFVITIRPLNASQAQPRKIVSVKDDKISALHFFDINTDTFVKDKVDFNKGWIGVYMEDVKEKGILVKMVVKGSPADTSGLMSGDIITEINGKSVRKDDNSNLVRFKKIVEDTGKDNIANLKIIRNGKTIEFNAKLIGKLLDRAYGYGTTIKKQLTPLFIDKFKERALNYDESFLKLAFSDKEFKNKCSETLQRIGEEIFVREGYQDSRATDNVFRLPLIDHLMTHPFDVPYSVKILHDSLVDTTPSEAFAAAANLLSLNTENEMNKSDPKKDTNVQTIIENIIKSIYNCMELRKEALGNLTVDEFRFLYDKAPDVFVESDENGADAIGTDETGADTIARFLEITGKIDMPKLMKSLRLVVDSIPFKYLQEIKPEALTLQPFDLPNAKNSKPNNRSKLKDTMSGFAGDVLFVQETDIGRIVVGGPGTTYYYDDAALIIDIGGDDFYFNNAGASGTETPVSICLDFAGNDVYNARSSFSQGSGRFGIGILIDLNGDDRYIGGDYCQGVGIFGIGLLYDTNGDDLYDAQSMCQGGGAFGIGLLYDRSGNDQYFSRRLSQGIGLTKGLGGIIDLAGNDQYSAGGKYPDFRDPDRSFVSFSQGFGLGMRPDETIVGASGGIGLLFDEDGNDSYYGDYFCQGSSYYFSLGVLYDKSGHDQYFAGRYSQGAGIHSSIGILRDDKGNDVYSAYFGVSQACGYDTGVGYLVDLEGDDYYKSNVMSQGTGGEKGLGVLVDFKGNDYYYANGGSQGYSYTSTNETFFGIGILGDAGGNSDVFGFKAKNDTLNYGDNAGVLLNNGD